MVWMMRLLYESQEMPSPLYLKDLYSHLGEKLTRPADHDDKCETKELENKLVVRMTFILLRTPSIVEASNNNFS